MLASSSQVLATQPIAFSPPTSSLNMPNFSHVVMLRTQAVGVKSLQAAERSADLAPACFNCWQSTECTVHLQNYIKKLYTSEVYNRAHLLNVQIKSVPLKEFNSMKCTARKCTLVLFDSNESFKQGSQGPCRSGFGRPFVFMRQF